MADSPARASNHYGDLREIPELNGLRGIAILLVLLFHYRGSTPGPFGQLSFLYWGVEYGWTGVDLFFVLSGFLITRILIHTKESPKYFSSFYARRVLRIFPLYFFAVFLFFYVELPWFHQQNALLTVSSSEQFWYWTYLSNWRDAVGHIIWPVGHFWSLGVEEQFYIVWPLAIWFCRRERLPAMCLGTIAISCVLRMYFEASHAEAEFIHRATITRLDTLALGGLLAAVYEKPKWVATVQSNLKLILPTLLGAFIVVSLASRPKPFLGASVVSYPLIAGIYACLVFQCATRSGTSALFCRAMRWRLLRSIGKYSYSMYVFHILVKQFALYRLFMLVRSIFDPPLPVTVILAIALGGVLTYALAFATWHLLEKHILKLKSYFPYEVAAVPESTQDLTAVSALV